MHCCGVRTYEDWYDISSWPGERWVPASCCRTVVNQTAAALMSAVEGSGDHYGYGGSDCGRSQNPALWWDRSCADVLHVWIVRRLCIVGTVALVIAFLQVWSWTCSLYRSIQKLIIQKLSYQLFSFMSSIESIHNDKYRIIIYLRINVIALCKQIFCSNQLLTFEK